MIKTIAFFVAAFVLSANTVTVNMTENGFEPREVAIEKNTTVTFVNKDKVSHWPASNIHPTHGIYPEFDPKRPIKAGESWSFTFRKSGVFKYHDHLLPHLRGTITVTGDFERGPLTKLKDFFLNLIMKVANVFNKQKPMFDVKLAWKNVTNHDQAHLLGTRIWETRGLAGIALCNPSFAYGCYHGFTDAALTKDLSPLLKLAKACELVGKEGSGPWASCIHGIGHGVATYFDTFDLAGSLSTCDRLKIGQTYCHDGVFMEFATNAKTPPYPCDTVDAKYRGACARNQPRVLAKYFGMNFNEIVKACLSTADSTVRFHCIDAIGLGVGQKSGGSAEIIINECGKINDLSNRSQCVSAASGEIVFQNFPGWQAATISACRSVDDQFRRSCEERVRQVITSYQR